MSNWSPYSSSGSAFPPPNFSCAPTGGNPTMNLNRHLPPSTNTFNQRIHDMNTPKPNPPHIHMNNFMHPRPSIYGSNTVNNNSNSISQPALPLPRFGNQMPQYYPRHPSSFQNQPNFINNAFSHSEIRPDNALFRNNNTHQVQSVGVSNISADIRNEIHPNNPQVFNVVSNNVSNTFNSSPKTMMPSITQSSNAMNFTINNSIPSSAYAGNSQVIPIMPSSSVNTLPPMQNSYSFPIPPPVFTSNVPPYLNLTGLPKSEKEIELDKFLSKFSCTKEKEGSQITIPEYRSVLKAAFSLLKLLVESKCRLTSLTSSDEDEWNSELENVSNYQKQLTEICSLISAPVHLSAVMKKLKFIKRKKELKKKTKLNKLSQKIKMEQHRKELNQEIDKYLDDIKEKVLKEKKEAEMKKEADYILLEVRKKIHEAKRTIEKIKVLEKLRNARQENSYKKGLYVPPEHNLKFVKEVNRLKETMYKQLADYEAEEKALKVMLETEQEGQLEEENQWKLKKIKAVQEKKKNHIRECLFGNSEEPQPTDPMFLFHKYQNSANDSIENLVKIRQQWDVYLSEGGEAVPHQWITPAPPSNPSWESWLMKSSTSKS